MQLAKIVVLIIGVLMAGVARAETITLRVWTMLTVQTQIDELTRQCNEFMKLYPNVKIEIEPIPYSVVYPRMMSAIEAGTPPNVFNCIEAMVAFMQAKNALVPVNELIDRLGRDDFFPGLLSWVTRDGHIWAVPDWQLHTSVWYRKDLVEERGLSHLVPAKSWDDLYLLAKGLTIDQNGDGKVDVYGMAIPLARFMVADQTFAAFAYPAGVKVFDPETGKLVFDKMQDSAIKVVEFVMKLYREVSPAGSLNWSWPEYRTAFVRGDVAMIIGWGATVLQMKNENPALLEKVGLFPVPGPTADQYPPKAFLGGGYFWTVGKDPDQEKVAMSLKLVEFLCKMDNVIARVNTRPVFALPARKSGFLHPDFVNNPLVRLYSDDLETLKNIVVPYVYRLGLEAGLNPLSGIIEGSALFGDALQRVAVGTWKPEEAIAWISQQLVMLEATLR